MYFQNSLPVCLWAISHVLHEYIFTKRIKKFKDREHPRFSYHSPNQLTVPPSKFGLFIYFFASHLSFYEIVFEYVCTHIHMYIHMYIHTHIHTYTCDSNLLFKRHEYNHAMPLFGDMFSSHLQCPGTLSTYRFISFSIMLS